ncbi:MAG TPA: hypothetical protein VE978_26650 [Chitinophagales bacterium]|nr:hypothetical protein [Chitinophagales bacterium]
MNQRIIENPVMNERIEFITTAAETNGTSLEFYQTLFRPRSGFIKEHVHFDIDETFEIMEGIATYSINLVSKAALRGEVVFIPRGIRHINPYNKHNEKLVLKRTLYPDGGLEMFYRKLYQLAREGKLNRNGEPGLLQISVIARNNLTQTYFTFLPVSVQKIVFYILGNVGEWLGYKHTPN